MAELSFRDIEWALEEALLEMFPSAQVEVYVDPEPPAPYIVAVYPDYLIIETYDGDWWTYWKVSYSINGETIIAPRSEWEEAESQSEWVTKAEELKAKALKAQQEIEFDIDVPCGKKAIKIIDVDSRRIGAYATIWGELDCDGERMTRKALEPSFVRIKAKEAIPWMFWKHGIDPKFGSVIVGHWDPDSFVMDDLGLYVEGNLEMDENGTKALGILQIAGSIGLSVGTMWYLVKREKAADGTMNILDWPLVDISIMEGAKQCVPSAMRNFQNKVLKGLFEEAVVKMGLETEQEEEKSSARSPLQDVALRI